MKSAIKKSIVSILITLFIVPSVVFLPPKPVDAGGGIGKCVGTLLGAMGQIGSAISSIMGVPIANQSIQSSSASTMGSTMGDNIKNCTLDVLVSIAANRALDELTSSIVAWINSGFQGSPSFVTDPEGFFMEVGDQAGGQFLSEMGGIGKILCSPFDLQIRISLGLGFNSKLKEYAGCRLSDVQKNVYNAFTGGVWGKDGWKNWVSVSRPQNNVYGAYLYSSDAMNKLVLEKAGIKRGQLAEGRGFLSYEKCVKWSEPQQSDGSEDGSRAEGNGRICLKKEVQTPGSVIEGQLNHALGLESSKLVVADNINAIFDALANQMIGKIFKAGGGLLGTTQTKPGGKSYVQQLVKTYDQQLAAAKAKPPQGIDCRINYDIVDAGSTGEGTIYKSEPGFWERNTTDGPTKGLFNYYPGGNFALPPTTVVGSGVKRCVPLTGLIEGRSIECQARTVVVASPTGIPINPLVATGGKTLETVIREYKDQIYFGCANSPIDREADQAISNVLADAGLSGQTPQLPPCSTVQQTAQQARQNLALNGVAQNAYTFAHSSGINTASADNAIDGDHSYLFSGESEGPAIGRSATSCPVPIGGFDINTSFPAAFREGWTCYPNSLTPQIIPSPSSSIVPGSNTAYWYVTGTKGSVDEIRIYPAPQANWEGGIAGSLDNVTVEWALVTDDTVPLLQSDGKTTGYIGYADIDTDILTTKNFLQSNGYVKILLPTKPTLNRVMVRAPSGKPTLLGEVEVWGVPESTATAGGSSEPCDPGTGSGGSGGSPTRNLLTGIVGNSSYAVSNGFAINYATDGNTNTSKTPGAGMSYPTELLGTVSAGTTFNVCPKGDNYSGAGLSFNFGSNKYVESVNFYVPKLYNSSTGLYEIGGGQYTVGIGTYSGTTDSLLSSNNGTPANTLKLTTPVIANSVTIWPAGTCNKDLTIGEIEVMGKDTAPAGGTVPTSAVKFTSDTITNPVTRSIPPSEASLAKGSLLPTRIRLRSDQPLPSINVKAKLEKVEGTRRNYLPGLVLPSSLPSPTKVPIFSQINTGLAIPTPAVQVKRYAVATLPDANRDVVWTTAPTAPSNTSEYVTTQYAREVGSMESSGINVPPPSSGNEYYLEILANMSDLTSFAAVDFGTYELTFTVTEQSDPNKVIGTVMHTFTVTSPIAQ